MLNVSDNALLKVEDIASFYADVIALLKVDKINAQGIALLLLEGLVLLHIKSY